MTWFSAFICADFQQQEAKQVSAQQSGPHFWPHPHHFAGTAAKLQSLYLYARLLARSTHVYLKAGQTSISTAR